MSNTMQAKLEPSANATEFLLRRIHSLTGLVPLVFFLIFHLTANSLALESPERFNQVVDFLRGIPHLEIVEMTLLGIPFLYHGLYGLVITPVFLRDKVTAYSHVRNLTYYFQRITGVITLIFLIFHVWQFRFVEELDFNVVAQALSQPVWAVAYGVGISCAIYHLANGLWNFFISWGITVGRDAQRMSGYLCLALGLALWGIGMLDLYVFTGGPRAVVENAAAGKLFSSSQCESEDEQTGTGKCELHNDGTKDRSDKD